MSGRVSDRYRLTDSITTILPYFKIIHWHILIKRISRYNTFTSSFRFNLNIFGELINYTRCCGILSPKSLPFKQFFHFGETRGYNLVTETYFYILQGVPKALHLSKWYFLNGIPCLSYLWHICNNTILVEDFHTF